MLRQCYFGSGHNVTELAEFAGHGSFESIRIELLPREPDVQRAWATAGFPLGIAIQRFRRLLAGKAQGICV